MTTLAKKWNEMKVEREIAGFAFPFAAGVTAAVIPGVSPYADSATYHIIASVAVLISSILLIRSTGRQHGGSWQWCFIGLCALTCGIFTGLTGIELYVSEVDSEGMLSKMTDGFRMKFEAAIENISFRNDVTGGVIKALLTGSREGVDAEVTQTFRDSGASHILALSGLHLGIIYVIVTRLLSFIGNSPVMRRIKSVTTILICGFYTLATGAGASITRAFIFITLNEAGKMTGRYTSLKTVLASALMLHLAVDPLAVSEVGFQLSYAAIFGIAYISPWLVRMWSNNWRLLKWIWGSAAVSISCQITTGPLAYLYFGTFPQYFLLTNMIAVPLAGLIIPAALITVLLSELGFNPSFTAAATEWLVTAMTESLSIIATM